MATSVKAIATVEVGAGGAASIEFTSIPADWSDLLVVLSGRSNTIHSSDGAYCLIEFNGSTANLSNRYLLNNEGTPVSGSSASNIVAFSSASNFSGFSNIQWYIPNYAGSANKSVSVDAVTENNSTTYYSILTAGLWSNSAAITSIKLNPISPAQFAQYSTATLYGIKG
jgi:hypothetical protein